MEGWPELVEVTATRARRLSTTLEKFFVREFLGQENIECSGPKTCFRPSLNGRVEYLLFQIFMSMNIFGVISNGSAHDNIPRRSSLNVFVAKSTNRSLISAMLYDVIARPRAMMPPAQN